jgi:hypothetical protein
MPNAIKYKTGNLTGSLQKSDIALGVNTGSIVGPTSNTGWFSGITPSAGRYIIYETSAGQNPRIYYPANDAELSLFNTYKGATGDNTGSAANCLAWIATQTNLFAVNFAYENIVTDGLQLNLDAGFVSSYPTTASTWYDISGNANNGALQNNPTFNSSNSGSFVFNGSNQTSNLTSLNLQQNFTLTGWYKPSVLTGFAIFGQGAQNPSLGLHVWYTSGTLIRFGMFANDTDFTVSTSVNNWYYISCTYNNSSPYTKQLYINGVAQTGATQQAQSAYNGTGTFRLGATYGSSGNYGSGSFAGMTMYNRILSSTEILQNFNAQKARYGL